MAKLATRANDDFGTGKDRCVFMASCSSARSQLDDSIGNRREVSAQQLALPMVRNIRVILHSHRLPRDVGVALRLHLLSPDLLLEESVLECPSRSEV